MEDLSCAKLYCIGFKKYWAPKFWCFEIFYAEQNAEMWFSQKSPSVWVCVCLSVSGYGFGPAFSRVRAFSDPVAGASAHEPKKPSLDNVSVCRRPYPVPYPLQLPWPDHTSDEGLKWPKPKDYLIDPKLKN